MGSLNKVQLIGFLGKDLDLRATQKGEPVGNFSMATTESWNDKNSGEKQERTEWHNLVIWGKRAEGLKPYLVKGKQIYVEGKLQTRKWEDKEGKTRYTTEIVVSEIVLLSDGKGGKNGGGGSDHHAPEQPTAGGSNFNDDQIPF